MTTHRRRWLGASAILVESGRRRRRGGAASYIAISLPIIGMFGALCIEVIYLHVVQQQLQGISDAAAHAALLEIDGSAAGLTAAEFAAEDVVDGMRVNGRDYALDATDVEFGYLDDMGAFVESNDPALVDSVRVVPVESVGLGFGEAFFGKRFDVTACAAVTQGDGNANTGDEGGPGLENGHFDFDTVDARTQCKGGATCAGTNRHTHQYDDSFNVTSVDLFAPLASHLAVNGCTDSKGRIAPCGGAGTTRTVPDAQTFKVLVINADLSPGAWLTVNGVDSDVTAWDDETFGGATVYSIGAVAGATRLTQLRMNFDIRAIANCELIPTQTGSVRANTPGINNEWRSGALTVQVVTTGATQTTGRSGGGDDVVISQANGLLYEATFFWHWDGAAYTASSAAAWQADYDLLECDTVQFIDSTSAGGACP